MSSKYQIIEKIYNRELSEELSLFYDRYYDFDYFEDCDDYYDFTIWDYTSSIYIESVFKRNSIWRLEKYLAGHLIKEDYFYSNQILRQKKIDLLLNGELSNRKPLFGDLVKKKLNNEN